MATHSKTRTYGQATRTTPRALLDAGRRLFAEHGFDGVTVDTLAREAGVNKAMISYHFGGKEGLYSAILDTTFAPVHEKLETIRTAPIPAGEQLHRYFQVFHDIARDHPTFPRMVLREVLAGGRHLKPQHLPNFLGVFGVLRFIVQKGIAEGQFRPIDPVTAFLIVNGGLIFFLSTETFRDRVLKALPDSPPFPEVGRFVETFEEFVVRGLRPDDGAAASNGTEERSAR